VRKIERRPWWERVSKERKGVEWIVNFSEFEYWSRDWGSIAVALIPAMRTAYLAGFVAQND
jgi:hypothetical protein